MYVYHAHSKKYKRNTKKNVVYLKYIMTLKHENLYLGNNKIEY